MQQTTLPIHLDNQPSLNNYYPANIYLKQLLNSLHSGLNQPGQYYLLTGNLGSGKTHLLKAHYLHTQRKRCYIPCKQLAKYQPDLLENLDNHLICLDDIEHLLGNTRWEQALFRIFIQARSTLLMSSSHCEPATKVLLPDLKSRLSACLHLKIADLSDDEQKQALAYRAQSRGMLLNDKLLQWLQHHAPRNNHTLFDILGKLDQYCLRNQCKPNIGIIQKLIPELNTHRPTD